MRKTDQVLMWEAFEGSISQGGPLGGSSKSSSSGQSSGNDSEESDAPGLMGLLAQVLQGVEDGSIDEGEACEHLSMILNGEAGEEDDSPEEQDMEDEDEDCMEDDEDYEDEENVKRKPRPSADESKRSMGVRGFGRKDVNRPKKTPKLDAMGRPLKDSPPGI